jgi:hypothetical protein
VDRQDVERIARAALRELGLPTPDLAIEQVDGQPGQWRIDIRGNRQGPDTLKIKCGEGSSAQWVRTQIIEQYTA